MNSRNRISQASCSNTSPPSRLAPTTLIGVSEVALAAGDRRPQRRALLRELLHRLRRCPSTMCAGVVGRSRRTRRPGRTVTDRRRARASRPTPSADTVGRPAPSGSSSGGRCTAASVDAWLPGHAVALVREVDRACPAAVARICVSRSPQVSTGRAVDRGDLVAVAQPGLAGRAGRVARPAHSRCCVGSTITQSLSAMTPARCEPLGSSAVPGWAGP